MSISARYRQLSDEICNLKSRLEDQAGALRTVGKAAETIDEFLEQVGEIPQVRLEVKLTPVLLKAHNHLDQARLTLENAEGENDVTANSDAVWAVQQQIYRLLNDL